MRTLGLRPCISRRIKVGLPLALSKLPKQIFFSQKFERLGGVVTDIESIQNVPKYFLRQAGESVGAFELL
jgi:hypothetical protein